MLETHAHATINPAPHRTKRFHVEDMRRIPVSVTRKARDFLAASTRQGRIFPQALSEFFGTLPEVERVEMDMAEDGRVMIHVRHREDDKKHHRFHLACEDVAQPSKPARQGFDAARTADELLRLYRTDILKEGSA